MMQTGALIVAAGKSSRMGDFKPMLQLGSISIAQRVDVYKRQLWSCCRSRYFHVRYDWIQSTSQRCMAVSSKTCFHYFISVSYTHLDVYKRQPV